MLKKDRISLLLIFIISSVYSYIFRFEYDISNGVTFLSILTGFHITAFSLLFNSKTVSELYQFKDSEDKTITLKHRLKNYYANSLSISMISLLYFLIFPNKLYCFHKEYLFVPIICLNVFVFYSTNRNLYKIFIKENNEEFFKYKNWK